MSVLKDVYEPSDDTWLASKLLDYYRGSDLFRKLDVCVDMGSGTGFLGLYSLVKGICGRVIFIDINEKALVNTSLNLGLNKLGGRGLILDSSTGLRDSIAELVIANPPYLPGNPMDDLDKAFYTGPEGYEVVVEFIREACRLLRVGGFFILTYSSLSNTGVIEREIAKCFGINKVESKRFFFEELRGLLLEKSGVRA
ncbi:MAG: methyltransferase [Thermogladius sp.]|nr:methyltransferase [Thermogladius sp.]